MINGEKVLHINCFDQMGGAEQLAMDLISLQNSRLIVKEKYTKNTSVIQMPRNPLNKIIGRGEWPFRKLGAKRGIKELFCFGDSFNGTDRTLRSLEVYKKAEIIHLHNIHGSFFDLNALVQISKDKKIIWTLHDMWCMTGGEGYVFDDEGYKYGNARSPYKYLYPLKNPMLDRRKYYLEQKKRIFMRVSGNVTFVTPSLWLKDCLESSYVYNSNMTIKLIHNAVDDNIFFNKKERSWNKPRILFFNSLNPYKGSEIVLKSLGKINNELFDLVTVGIKTNFPNETYCGKFIDNRVKLADLYNMVDFLIFPSKAENFSLTLLEAAACEVFLFASDVGGNKEIIRESNGRLFKGEDQLIEQINWGLCHLNEARNLSKEGGVKIRAKCGLDNISTLYDRLYKELMIESIKDGCYDHEVIR